MAKGLHAPKFDRLIGYRFRLALSSSRSRLGAPRVTGAASPLGMWPRPQIRSDQMSVGFIINVRIMHNMYMYIYIYICMHVPLRCPSLSTIKNHLPGGEAACSDHLRPCGWRQCGTGSGKLRPPGGEPETLSRLRGLPFGGIHFQKSNFSFEPRFEAVGSPLRGNPFSVL